MASNSRNLTLDLTPFLPVDFGPIHEVNWSVNGTQLPGATPVISTQNLQEWGKGFFRLTLTFLDEDNTLYRVKPLDQSQRLAVVRLVGLRKWPHWTEQSSRR